MIIALIFYGVLVALAMWATAREENLRWIAAAIAASYAVSNMLWFLGTVPQRPGIYSMLEMFIIISAWLAYEIRRERALIFLVTVSALSICANIGLAAIEHPNNGQVRMHEILTNICFMIECLIVISLGVRDGVRTGRFGRLSRWRRGHPAPDVARRAEDA